MSVQVNTKLPADGGKIAVVYARYSSHSQGEQSIEGQLAAAKAYANARGYVIVKEYIDRAMTGRNDNRAEFQRMLSDATKKKFDVIIVWKVDRFGRNREEITFNKHHCKKHGVRVEYVAENLPDSPEAVILESVLEGMAEYYSLQLSQNIKRGYFENAKKGKFCGGRVPLGYKLDKDRLFVIDPETAPIVKLIFQWYAAGETMSEIQEKLNAQGITTSVGEHFNKNSFRRMLKNEKYIGNMVFRGGEVRVDGAVPAIIDRDTFDKVQEMLKVNKRAPAAKWSKADYILTGKLFCGSCGAMMVGECGTSKTGSTYNYYLCTNHKRLRTCSQKAVRQDVIESYVLDYVSTILKDDELMDFIVDKTWEYYQSQDEQQEKIKILQKQLAEVEKATTNLLRAIEAGIFNTATKNRMDELDSQRAAITAAIAGHELEHGFRLTKDHIRYFLDKMRTADTSDRDVQKRLIETFVNSIFIYPDKITITFNYSGENQKQVSFEEMNRVNSGEVFDCCVPSSTKARTYELIIWGSVFAITVKHPAK